MPPKTRMSRDRAERKLIARSQADRSDEDYRAAKPHARLGSRKAGHSEHWLAKAKRRKALRASLGGITTESMIEHCPEAAFIAEAYPTALTLAEAEYADLVKLKGVGPKRLTKLRAYLSKNNVSCAWKVPA